MNLDNIELARRALGEFERDMTASGAVHALREGLDYILEILESPQSDARGREVARNTADSYKRKLIERISVVLDDPGSFEDDYYWYWFSLIGAFERAGLDEDGSLSQVRPDLAMKALATMSRNEKSQFLEWLKRDLEGES